MQNFMRMCMCACVCVYVREFGRALKRHSRLDVFLRSVTEEARNATRYASLNVKETMRIN